jgi:hypothetical protein
MAYVPVKMWVPDTTEGPVAEEVNLKACDTCRAGVPMELMDEHVAVEHPPPPEVTPAF